MPSKAASVPLCKALQDLFASRHESQYTFIAPSARTVSEQYLSLSREYQAKDGMGRAVLYSGRGPSFKLYGCVVAAQSGYAFRQAEQLQVQVRARLFMQRIQLLDFSGSDLKKWNTRHFP